MPIQESCGIILKINSFLLNNSNKLSYFVSYCMKPKLLGFKDFMLRRF